MGEKSKTIEQIKKDYGLSLKAILLLKAMGHVYRLSHGFISVDFGFWERYKRTSVAKDQIAQLYKAQSVDRLSLQTCEGIHVGMLQYKLGWYTSSTFLFARYRMKAKLKKLVKKIKSKLKKLKKQLIAEFLKMLPEPGEKTILLPAKTEPSKKAVQKVVSLKGRKKK